jgi:F-type H+-transporting ATPase subunit alpha
MKVEEQTAIIYAGTKGLLRSVPVKKIKEFEVKFIDFMRANHQDTLDALKTGKLTSEISATLEKVVANLSATY